MSSTVAKQKSIRRMRLGPGIRKPSPDCVLLSLVALAPWISVSTSVKCESLAIASPQPIQDYEL